MPKNMFFIAWRTIKTVYQISWKNVQLITANTTQFQANTPIYDCKQHNVKLTFKSLYQCEVFYKSVAN